MSGRLPFTVRMAQEKLARMDNEALVSHLTDTTIAVALRRGVTPQRVMRDALESFGWDEGTWRSTVEPYLREELKDVVTVVGLHEEREEG